MSTKKTGKLGSNKTNLAAGIAGAGSGTLLLIWTKNTSQGFQDSIKMIAPSVSVGCAAFWKFFTHHANRTIKGWIAIWKHNNLKRQFDIILNDPNISDAKKEEIRKKYEQLSVEDFLDSMGDD